jgi:hypothetical protein
MVILQTLSDATRSKNCKMAPTKLTSGITDFRMFHTQFEESACESWTLKTWWLHFECWCYLVNMPSYKCSRFERPPSWISNFSSSQTFLGVTTSDCSTQKTHCVCVRVKCCFYLDCRQNTEVCMQTETFSFDKNLGLQLTSHFKSSKQSNGEASKCEW